MTTSSDECIELTESLIKYATGQFDTSVVRSLSLPMLCIGSISSSAFLNCSMLTSLDLSNNRLTSLKGVECLVLLQVVNISLNAITSLDALQHCVALEVLHAEGNKIESKESLAKLEFVFLPKLRALHLQSKDGSTSNPMCANRKEYVSYMTLHFGHLRCLDGHYFCKEELNPRYIDAGNDREIVLPESKPWASPGYFDNVFVEPAKIGVIPEQAFHVQVADSKKVLAAAVKSTR